MSSVKKPRGGWIAPAIFVAAFLAGAGIVYVAIAGMASGASLGDGAAVIDARVTDTRVVQYRRRGDSYEVRYAFDVGGQTYTYKDPTERTDLWAPPHARGVGSGAYERHDAGEVPAERSLNQPRRAPRGRSHGGQHHWPRRRPHLDAAGDVVDRRPD